MGWVASTSVALGYILDTGEDANDNDRLVAEKKTLFWANFPFDVGVFFPKASLICFYYNLFEKSHRKERIILKFITLYTGMAFLVTVFSDIFTCGLDISVNW